MTCAWNELLDILPHWLRKEVSRYENRILQEIHMRINSPPELMVSGKSVWLSQCVQQEDLTFCINIASRYSPWAASTTAQGYITAPGGHRIGICGDVVVKNGILCGIRQISSLCIRIARDFPGISGVHNYVDQSLLILGAPGVGKTTLLRDIARNLASVKNVCVIDERKELFPTGFQPGVKMDILAGCPKAQGILNVLRTMGPEIIVVDEITDPEDCRALMNAVNCGVKLLATAHAYDFCDYMQKALYEPLRKQRIFDGYLIMHKDKTFSREDTGCITNGLERC